MRETRNQQLSLKEIVSDHPNVKELLHITKVPNSKNSI